MPDCNHVVRRVLFAHAIYLAGVVSLVTLIVGLATAVATLGVEVLPAGGGASAHAISRVERYLSFAQAQRLRRPKPYPPQVMAYAAPERPAPLLASLIDTAEEAAPELAVTASLAANRATLQASDAFPLPTLTSPAPEALNVVATGEAFVALDAKGYKARKPLGAVLGEELLTSGEDLLPRRSAKRPVSRPRRPETARDITHRNLNAFEMATLIH